MAVVCMTGMRLQPLRHGQAVAATGQMLQFYNIGGTQHISIIRSTEQRGIALWGRDVLQGDGQAVPRLTFLHAVPTAQVDHHGHGFVMILCSFCTVPVEITACSNDVTHLHVILVDALRFGGLLGVRVEVIRA